MDAFERLRDHRTHAEQARALGGPVARRAAAVLLAREHHERDASGRIRLRGVVDGLLRAREEVPGVPALHDVAIGVGQEQVLEADVRERAADHHLVVAAPAPIGVEVLARDAVLGEVPAGGAVQLDGSRRGDVVGRHGVTQEREDARARDRSDRRRLHRQALEVRGPPHVRGVRVPRERVAQRGRKARPARIPREDVGVVLDEHPAVDGRPDDRLDLRGARPDVAEEHLGAVATEAERLGLEVEVHRPRERVRDHERGRREVVHLHVGVDASLEVAVAAQDRDDGEVVLVHRAAHVVRQGAGVADAGGAAVADEVVAERLEVRPKPRLLVVVRDDLGARRH